MKKFYLLSLTMLLLSGNAFASDEEVDRELSSRKTYSMAVASRASEVLTPIAPESARKHKGSKTKNNNKDRAVVPIPKVALQSPFLASPNPLPSSPLVVSESPIHENKSLTTLATISDKSGYFLGVERDELVLTKLRNVNVLWRMSGDKIMHSDLCGPLYYLISIGDGKGKYRLGLGTGEFMSRYTSASWVHHQDRGESEDEIIAANVVGRRIGVEWLLSAESVGMEAGQFPILQSSVVGPIIPESIVRWSIVSIDPKDIRITLPLAPAARENSLEAKEVARYPSAELHALHEIIFRKKMEGKAKPKAHRLLTLGISPEALASSKDKVSGPMNIPEPMQLHENGDMTPEDFRKCSSMMNICLNMVQQTITNAAKISNIPVTEALKSMDAWVTGLTDFPLPIFNFRDAQHQTINQEKFSIDVNPDVIDSILSIRNVPALKDSIIKALQKTNGHLASYSKLDKTFNYFGIITGYSSSEISIRAVKFGMRMKETEVKSLCGGGSQTRLDSDYDTYQFVGDKEMMIKIWEKNIDRTADYIANALFDLMKSFYDKQLVEYGEKVKNLLRKA